MAKIRVHELAKKLAIDNKSILNALKKIGVTGKSHSSSLDDHLVQKIKRVLLGYDVEPEPQPEKPTRKKAAAARKVVRKRSTKTGAAVEPGVEEAPAAPEPAEAPAEPEPAPAAEAPPKTRPAKKAEKDKKVVINLAEMQAKLGGEAPTRLEDLPKLKASLDEANREVEVAEEKKKAEAELARLGTEATAKKRKAAAPAPATPDDDDAEKVGRAANKDKLKKFKGKAFQTMEQVQVSGRLAGAGGLRPSFPRSRGRRRPARGAQRVPTPRTTHSRRVSSAPTTAPRRKDIKIREGVTVKEFAELTGQKVNDIIKKLMELGQLVTVNHPLDADAAQIVAEAIGVNIEVVPIETEAMLLESEADDETSLLPRAPVVTVMGHVDHGKTSLLDVIRKANVTEGEAGGITQHIGAYSVQVKDRNITFLDTPGHEAFTAMRARGAGVTDVVVLVVAADDGVMPQTIEAIDHANAAKVPIVVAVNKIDKPDANPDKVKGELAEKGLTPEDWGGQTIFCEVSAKQEIGIDHLLEMILLQADVLELKANPDRAAQGTVVEARLDRGRGPVATMLVQTGTLAIGDIVLTGTIYGKVRTLNDHKGKRVTKAGPAIPVELVGLSGVPTAGDPFVVVDDERKARQIAVTREEKLKAREIARKPKVSLKDLFNQIQQGEVKDLNILVKADVQGSVEAVRDALAKIAHPEVKVNVIHALPGGITESDIMLANASNAIVIGFNVRPEPKAVQLAEREGVDIRLYSVIYQAVDDVKQALEGMLAPTLNEKVLGRAEVRQTYQASRLGTIAGCYVLDGIVSRNCSGIRVIRDNVVIYDGKIGSLKRFKDDAKEVAAGYECGITVEKFNDIKVGDVLEDYLIESVATKLDD